MLDRKFEYEDLLSGDYIIIDGVGLVRSPRLEEMRPTSGIGWSTYNEYIYFMRITLNQFLKIIDKKESTSDLYNEIVSNEFARELFERAFSFFMFETVIFSSETNSFICFRQKTDEDGNQDYYAVGSITADNFDDIRAAILVMNYIPLSKTDIKTKHSSKESEDAWNKMQAFLEENSKTNEQDENMTVGNLLSKLCAIHPSINYLNVYKLTVFQFYDTFFQTSYMRSIQFSERIVSNHGSNDFKYSDWIKSIES